MKTSLEWMHELKVVDNPDTMCIKIAAIQADAQQDVEESEQLRSQLEQALAACEEMRKACVGMVAWYETPESDQPEKLPLRILACEQALSTNCGKGMVPAEQLKEAQSDRDEARKEAAKTLVQLGKVEDQRDECLSLLRVLQPEVKMWLAGSGEYEWIGKLLEGRFGEGIYKPK